jgi:hypothetical protein
MSVLLWHLMAAISLLWEMLGSILILPSFMPSVIDQNVVMYCTTAVTWIYTVESFPLAVFGPKSYFPKNVPKVS